MDPSHASHLASWVKSIFLLKTCTYINSLRIRGKKSLCYTTGFLKTYRRLFLSFPKDSPAKELSTINSKVLFREDCYKQVCMGTSKKAFVGLLKMTPFLKTFVLCKGFTCLIFVNRQTEHAQQ